MSFMNRLRGRFNWVPPGRSLDQAGGRAGAGDDDGPPAGRVASDVFLRFVSRDWKKLCCRGGKKYLVSAVV